MHVFGNVGDLLLTVACARHFLQHDKRVCTVRVYTPDGQGTAPTESTTVLGFETTALRIARAQLGLGPPAVNGSLVRLLQIVHVILFAASIIATIWGAAFILDHVINDFDDLLRSKNPAMIAAWLLPGGGLYGLSVAAESKVMKIRDARL